MTRLVLWDIDGALIDASGFGWRAVGARSGVVQSVVAAVLGA